MQIPALTLIAVLLMPLIAFADGIRFETERGNVYAAGRVVTIPEDSLNDIVAAGGDVSISGNAANEVLAAGGSLMMSGKAGGDVRMAGGEVTLAGAIGGEAMLAGGRVRLLSGARIGSGMFAAGGDIVIEGTVDGSARIVGGTVSVNGTIGKDVIIKANHVIIGKKAKIGGYLKYEAPHEAAIDQDAVITGQKTFIHAVNGEPHKRFMAFLGALWIVKLFALLAAAIVIFLLLPERTAEVSALALDRFGHELLVGFLVFVAIPALVLILIITVLGWFLGLVLVFLYGSFVLLASVFGALIFARLVGRSILKKTHLTWLLVAAGVVVYQILGLIPFIGWLFKFVFFLAALGALSHSIYPLRHASITPR